MAMENLSNGVGTRVKTPRTARWLIAALCAASAAAFGQDTLPGTVALEMEGDLAAQMVDGIKRLLGAENKGGGRRPRSILESRL